MSKVVFSQTGSGLATSDAVEMTVSVFDGGASGGKSKLYDIGTLLASAVAGGVFTQPANAAVEIISNSALDVQTATIYGNQNAALTTLVSETVTLTGLSAVTTSTYTNWVNILGVELSSAAVGTITIRKAVAGATIKTITAGNTQTGVTTPVDTDDFDASIVRIFASGATTKYVGIVGTTSAGVAQSEILTLAGATLVEGTLTFKTVTKVLLGDPESSVNVTAFAGERLVMLAAGTNVVDHSPNFRKNDTLRFNHGIYVFSTASDGITMVYTLGVRSDETLTV